MDKKEKLEFANPKVEESIDEKRKSLLLRSTTYLDKNALQYQNGILSLLDEDGTIKYLRKEPTAVFNRRFLKSILMPGYHYDLQTKKDSPLYSLAFLDFDHVNELNNDAKTNYYNPETPHAHLYLVDIAMAKAIDAIKEKLPKGSIISRLSGDEFIIIADNLSQKELGNFLESASSSLKNDPYSYARRLTYTYAVKDSLHASSSKELYLDVMKEVEELKLKHKDILNPQIDAKDNFLAFCQKQFRDLFLDYKFNARNCELTSFMENCLYEIRDKLAPEKLKEPTLMQQETSLKRKEVEYELENTIFTPKEAKDILQFVLKNVDSIAYSKNSIVHESDKLAKALQTHSTTGLFTKEFLFSILLPVLNQYLNEGKNFRLLKYDIYGLKPNNTAYGHVQTDYKLDNIKLQIKKELENTLSISFSTDTQNFSKNNNYIIDADAGNVYVIIGDDTIENRDIAKHYRNITRIEDDFLGVTAALLDSKILQKDISFHSANMSPFEYMIQKLNISNSIQKGNKPPIQISGFQKLFNRKLDTIISFYQKNQEHFSSISPSRVPMLCASSFSKAYTICKQERDSLCNSDKIRPVNPIILNQNTEEIR